MEQAPFEKKEGDSVRAADGEQILRGLILRELLTRPQLELILEVAATQTPEQAFQTLSKWAQINYLKDGNITRTAPARAARALAKLRLRPSALAPLEFRQIRDFLVALLATQRPPP